MPRYTKRPCRWTGQQRTWQWRLGGCWQWWWWRWWWWLWWYNDACISGFWYALHGQFNEVIWVEGCGIITGANFDKQGLQLVLIRDHFWITFESGISLSGGFTLVRFRNLPGKSGDLTRVTLTLTLTLILTRVILTTDWRRMERSLTGILRDWVELITNVEVLKLFQ